LARGEALLVVELLFLLLLHLLGELDLLSSALFKLGLLLEKFLLLLHGGFHGFVSPEHFLLHFVEPLEGFGGLLLLFLLDRFLGLELLNESRFFFFGHLGLSFNFSLLLLELLLNLFLFVLDLVLHLLHLLLVLDVGDLVTDYNATLGV
jgi:hypothetical protein